MNVYNQLTSIKWLYNEPPAARTARSGATRPQNRPFWKSPQPPCGAPSRVELQRGREEAERDLRQANVPFPPLPKARPRDSDGRGNN